MVPPRGNPRGQQGRARGRGRNTRGQARGPPRSALNIPSQVRATGMNRPGYGRAGRRIAVATNHFACKILPERIIHHYDVVILSGGRDNVFPFRFNVDLIARLQNTIAPGVFTPRAVYDGRRNLFAPRRLPLGDTDSREFPLPPLNGGAGPLKVRLTKVAEINLESLSRFLNGQQSRDNTVLTAITALNVVIKMQPTLNPNYVFNSRSFFTDVGAKDIGSGLVLWRGYSQSIRPAVGRMLINVDISTGVMYKPGKLLDLCGQFFNKPDPNVLAPSKGFPDRERVKLQRFITGMRIFTRHPVTGVIDANRARVIKKLSTAGARDLPFSLREGGHTTVAQYFQETYNSPLKYPDVVCVEVGSGALIPLEVCEVPPGQIMRKRVPPEKAKDVLDFSTKGPGDRLNSIRNGPGILQWGQSHYVRQFGLRVNPNVRPFQLQARVLQPPTLKYGPGSKQQTITPRDGAWNMVDKKFYKPMSIRSFAIVVFERKQRFNEVDAREMGKALITACVQVGMQVRDTNPSILYPNPQNGVVRELLNIGAQFSPQRPTPPLLVVVLPDGAADIYTAVKYFGDVLVGVATQCLKSHKCKRANPQYLANVCLKINVKLGGINTILDHPSVSYLTDLQNPTMVMGCATTHPAPGSGGRPSFASLVANVDSEGAKYIATSSVQKGRSEMVEDLKSMTETMINKSIDYKTKVEKRQTNCAPRRILFYRVGVSEGQFKRVLEDELPLIRAACEATKITPKITVIIVGKRRHVRFFPVAPNTADRSGNCPVGTVVDTHVVHPSGFDFYLQSHGGLLGTSHPAHYNVLHDENGFTADDLQQLTFALCHVYARATRSVSIPAPVYYAGIVSSRAMNHYDPEGAINFEESTGGAGAETTLSNSMNMFQLINPRQANRMYFA